ncbi:murein biosynthesis integral membrane protein MurJ [Lentisphaera profundi]|uniref:Lipid II flippase n=1 Tax=Lentisphaera profundi TaxID=1658616 RepID=A0ABY7VY59_9BACT|nr:murein biosynthesis integral membrane protein MurJ [Lentisphaera profundi]WDE97003.1 murein biosynthesis integral membrane protein MurJ [Lentisphaera profundi]
MSKRNTVNAIISGLGNLTGRMSGLIREMLYAYLFGTSPLIGYFKYAASLPNLARRMFGEGALANAFIPLLADIKKEDQKLASDFSSKILTLTTILNTALALLGIVILFSLGFMGIIKEENSSLIYLGSIMMPYLPLICLAGLLGSIHNLYGKFSLPALMSSSMNACLISASIISIFLKMTPEQTIYLLAFTLLSSGFLQVGILLKSSTKFISLKFKTCSLKAPELKTFWKSFIPVIIGASAQQISTALDKTIALFIGPHAVSSLSYSELIIYLPVGIVGVSLGSVCLPSLSESLAKGDQESVQKDFHKALAQTFFLSIPCSLLFYLIGESLLKILFLRGAFDLDSLAFTLRAFLWFLPGIPFFTALKVILPLYYSNKNTKTPLKVSVYMIALNLILGISFIPLLSHASLAMASVVSGTLNFIILLVFAKKLSYLSELKPLLKTFLLPLFSAILSFIIVNLVIQQYFNQLLPSLEFVTNLIFTLCVCASFSLFYFIAFKIFHRAFSTKFS